MTAEADPPSGAVAGSGPRRVGVASRWSPIGRWARAWRFAWAGSTARPLALARRWIGGELPPLVRCVESRLGTGAVSLAYLGLPEGLQHVLPFLEQQRDPGGGPARRTGRWIPWHVVARGRWLPDTDLVVVGTTARRVRRLPPHRATISPLRIHLVVPVVPDVAAMRRRVSTKDRQHFARQRGALDWRLEATSDPADFAHFYHRFHLPTMRLRHGAATRSVDESTAYERILRHGRLFFVTQSGRRVAGMLCHWQPRGATLTLRLAGVLDGASEHYRSGALLATYLLLQEWAAGHGVRRMDLSGCEPFLSKGIFQFKRKLHPEVVLPGNHFAHKRLWLQVRRDGPAVRDLLVANPVIVIGADGLEALYFHDRQRPPRLDLRWQGTTILRQRLVDLDEFLAGCQPVAEQQEEQPSASAYSSFPPPGGGTPDVRGNSPRNSASPMPGRTTTSRGAT
jgi:hypothetical protein